MLTDKKKQKQFLSVIFELMYCCVMLMCNLFDIQFCIEHFVYYSDSFFIEVFL